jgi:hypothetical protein
VTDFPPKLSPLTADQFAALDPARRAISHDHARRHAVLDLGGKAGRYALSWRSDLIEPVLRIEPANERLWMAVDQQVACIDRRTGEIRLCLALSSNAIDIGFAAASIAVLTETVVLLFNQTMTIRALVTLPDLPESMAGSNLALTIRMQGGVSRILDLDSGQLR